MTSNITSIRAAEAQIPQLRKELRLLREEAQVDGMICVEEQTEIDQLEGMIDTVLRLIEAKLEAWGSNKTTFEKLRSGLGAGLDEVARCDISALTKDQRAISVAVTKVDQAAATEDYAAAIGLVQELKRLVDLFVQRVENTRLSELTAEELAKTSLSDDAIDDVFTEAYMEELKTMEFKGEGTPELKDLIKEIEKGLSGARRTEVLADLAAVVGEPPSAAELDANYARFLILRKQRDEIAKQNDQAEPEGVDEEKHPDFVGSHAQLMFGKVLGDALGIHEVFATLLSPTGGLVGPGNDLIPGVMAAPHLAADNPFALHGTVHDAAGYLDSFHDEGPGYNYRDDPDDEAFRSAIESANEWLDGVDALLPLVGQYSGIKYWVMEDERFIALEKALAEVRDGVADKVGEIISAIDDIQQDISDAADDLRDDIEEAEQDLRDLTEEIETEVLEARDAFEDGVEKVAKTVVEKYEALSEDARGIGEGVMEKLDALANFIWN